MPKHTVSDMLERFNGGPSASKTNLIAVNTEQKGLVIVAAPGVYHPQNIENILSGELTLGGPDNSPAGKVVDNVSRRSVNSHTVLSGYGCNIP